MTAAKKIAFEIITQPTHLETKFKGTPDNDSAAAFETQIVSIIEPNPTHIVVHCDGLTFLTPAWTRCLLTLQQKLKSNEKQMRLVDSTHLLSRFLVQQGLNGSLQVCDTTRAALVEIGILKEKTFDVNFINPFLTATIAVLKTQASTEAKAGQIYKKDPRERFLGDISGVIGLVSDGFTGSVVISFPAATFLKVMSRMLGEDYKEINKDIEDGAGELTNIIFGQAKVVLNERGFGIKTALPSVITGQQHSILQMSNGPRMVIPFDTDAGPFFVEICTSN